MCVGVSVWLGWSGIRVADFSYTGYEVHPNKSKPLPILYITEHAGEEEQHLEAI